MVSASATAQPALQHDAGPAPTSAPAIAPRLLPWYERHGRHTLPWQVQRSAYRVWVSEVMLQQTQLATVIPYFERFVARFTDVAGLAGAPIDEVLALWSGLGYYARARSLHRAAQQVMNEHGGELPDSYDQLVALPGIGRSTAGAILAQVHEQRLPILDGNVKRVLTRYHAVDGWPGETGVARELWALAEQNTPTHRVRDYTQAIMDLGAMVCTRARPRCEACPLADGCVARATQSQRRYPAARPKRRRPSRSVVVLIVRDQQGRVLLQRRPPSGIWGGLYSFPELAGDDSAAHWCQRILGAHAVNEQTLAAFSHAFTHFELELRPVMIQLSSVPSAPSAVMEGNGWLWYNGSSRQVGLPAPVQRMLRTLAEAPEAGGSAGRQ